LLLLNLKHICHFCNPDSKLFHLSKFFQLHREIATEVWTEEQIESFLEMCNEASMNGEFGESDGKFGDDIPEDEKEVASKRLTFDIIFAGDNPVRDAMLPHYLGQLKCFDIAPRFQSYVEINIQKVRPAEAAALSNGEAMKYKREGDILLLQKHYDLALNKYFDAIRLVPYKRPAFYNNCCTCYTNLGYHELAMINAHMAATIDTSKIESWTNLANSAIAVSEIYLSLFLNSKSNDGNELTREVAKHLVQKAYDNLLTLYDEESEKFEKDELYGRKRGKDEINLVNMKRLIEKIELILMDGAVEDMAVYL
jgi:tetratricopeptide (TPR) repeat protein